MIINLNKRGENFLAMRVDLFNVIISRVKELKNLRRLPFYGKPSIGQTYENFVIENLEYLTHLRHDPLKLIWYHCYNTKGEWKPLESKRIEYLITLANIMDKNYRNSEAKKNNDKKKEKPFDKLYYNEYIKIKKENEKNFMLILKNNDIPLPKLPGNKTLLHKKILTKSETILNDIQNTPPKISKVIINKNDNLNTIITKKINIEKIKIPENFSNTTSPRINQTWKLSLINLNSAKNYLREQNSKLLLKKDNEELCEFQGDTITVKSFVSLSGYLNDAIINGISKLWCKLRPENLSKITVLNSYFFPSCSIGKDYITKEYNYDNVKRWTNKFNNDDFLNYPLLNIMHVPGHWIMLCILPKGHETGHQNKATLHILDGFNVNRDFETNIIKRWYKDEQIKWKRPIPDIVELDVIYHRNYYGDNVEKIRDIEQTDSISCGVNALLHAYYMIVENKFFASWNDFSYDHIFELRMFLIFSLYQHIKNPNVIDLSVDIIEDMSDDNDSIIIINERNNIEKTIIESINDDNDNFDDIELKQYMQDFTYN